MHMNKAVVDCFAYKCCTLPPEGDILSHCSGTTYSPAMAVRDGPEFGAGNFGLRPSVVFGYPEM